jgi:hypothetical protein
MVGKRDASNNPLEKPENFLLEIFYPLGRLRVLECFSQALFEASHVSQLILITGVPGPMTDLITCFAGG